MNDEAGQVGVAPGADRRQVAKVEVFVSLPVEPLVPSGEGPTERMLFGGQLVGLCE